MKKVMCGLVIVAAVGLCGAMFITQFQGITGGALSELKFESIPPKSGIVGAPPKYKVTKATIDYLQKLEKDKKTIEVQGDGAVKVE